MAETNGNDSINAIITPDGDQLQFGLTKREFFAAMAMQGLLANSGGALRDSEMNMVWAVRAVAFADALIRALNKEQEVPTTSPDPKH